MIALADFTLDVRRATRSLRRSPIVAIAAVVSIGLGAAAATTVFSIVDAALFRPPPFERPNELAILFMTRARPTQPPVERALVVASLPRAGERPAFVRARGEFHGDDFDVHIGRGRTGRGRVRLVGLLAAPSYPSGARPRVWSV